MVKRKLSYEGLNSGFSRPESSPFLGMDRIPPHSANEVCVLLGAVVELSTTRECMPLVDLRMDVAGGISDYFQAIESTLAASSSDFSTCEYIQRFRKRADGYIFAVTGRPQTDAQRVLCDLKSRVLSGDSDIEGVGECVTALCEAAKSKLLSVRFVALTALVSILPAMVRNPKHRAVLNRLCSVISSRCQDTSDLVRRLAVIEGVCEVGHVAGPENISDELMCSAIQGLLSDYSRINRLRMIAWLSRNLTGNAPSPRIVKLLGRIGPDVVRRCFDSDDAVAVSALRLLAHERVGEEMLGPNEALYQQVSNLVWHIGPGWLKDGPKRTVDPFRVAREALSFVNTHILASPGIFAESSYPDQQLAMLIEFLSQYSDGHIAPFAARLVCTFMSHCASRKTSPVMLLDSKVYLAVLADTRDKTDSQDPAQQAEGNVKTSAVLEILLAVCRVVDTNALSQIFSDELRATLEDIARGSLSLVQLNGCRKIQDVILDIKDFSNQAADHLDLES